MKITEQSTQTDTPYLGVLDDVAFRPVFIMGDHRTGTTLLYQMLDATQCFNVVRAYHVVKYDEILANHATHTEAQAKQALADYFERIGVNDRMIDGVRVTPDLPEEYGFILDSARNKAQLTPANVPRFIELCKKVQYVSDPNRPLLLKNPWDFLQFNEVKQAFPASKFIFLHRNPIQVINSQLRAIRSLVTTRNAYLALVAKWYRQILRRPLRRYTTRLLFSSHFEFGLRIVSRHVARATTYFLEHVDLLPDTDYISIRYEDLCADPSTTIGRIVRFLGVQPTVPVAFEQLIAPRRIRLLPEVARRQIELGHKLQPYYAFCGYDAAKGMVSTELSEGTP